MTDFPHDALQESLAEVTRTATRIADGLPEAPTSPAIVVDLARDVAFLHHALALAKELGVRGPRRIAALAALSLPHLAQEALAHRAAAWPAFPDISARSKLAPIFVNLLLVGDAATLDQVRVAGLTRRDRDDPFFVGQPLWATGGPHDGGAIAFPLTWAERFPARPWHLPAMARRVHLGPWVPPRGRRADGLTWRWVLDVRLPDADGDGATDVDAPEVNAAARRASRRSPLAVSLGDGLYGTFTLHVRRERLHDNGRTAADDCFEAAFVLSRPTPTRAKGHLKKSGYQHPHRHGEGPVVGAPQPPLDRLATAVGPGGATASSSAWDVLPMNADVAHLALLIGLGLVRQSRGAHAKLALDSGAWDVTPSAASGPQPFSRSERKAFRALAEQICLDALRLHLEVRYKLDAAALFEIEAAARPKLQRQLSNLLTLLADRFSAPPHQRAVRAYMRKWMVHQLNLKDLIEQAVKELHGHHESRGP